MISVVYCTRESNPKHSEHIKKTSGLANKIEIIEIVNKGESLTIAYNRGLKQATNDIVVFCHDDILFNSNSWGRKLLNHFKNSDYGILGIAGTTDMNENGQWWADKTKMVGIVKHSNDGKTWESRYSGNFGKEIIETIIVDGLFFAVHKKRVKESFDESVEGFHFYEIDYAFRNHLAGVKIGVVFDIKITHKSIGETNDEWEKNREIFAEKFKDKLPVKLDVETLINKKEISLRKKPKVKVIVSGGGDTEKLTKLHKQLLDTGYENYDISVVVSDENLEKYESLKLDKTVIHEGAFDTLHKSLSVLKWDEDFISEKDELVLFLRDEASIESDILTKFVSIYNKDKKLGCIFPRIINQDKTILSTGIVVNVMVEGEKSKINFNLKGVSSYYSYQEGITMEKLGNLGFCFMTTYANLTKHGWFRLDFDELFYETEFSAKCNLDGKNNYVDNDSVIKLDTNYLSDQINVNTLNNDFRTLVNCFNEDKRYLKLMKLTQKPQPQKAEA